MDGNDSIEIEEFIYVQNVTPFDLNNHLALHPSIRSGSEFDQERIENTGVGVVNEVSTNTILSYIFCALVDLHEGGKECSNSSKHVNKTCVECPMVGRFQVGGSMSESHTVGHVACDGLWLSIVLFGMFGILSNCIIIRTLFKQNTGKAFDAMLVALASFDLLCCIMTTMTSTAIISFLDNWGRSGLIIQIINITFLTALFARTGSAFMTVAVAVERYIFVAFPEKATIWLTTKNAIGTSFGVLFIAILLNLPRFISYSVVSDDDFKNIPSLLGTDYVIEATDMHRYWTKSVYSIHEHIDYWLPFPLLIVLTILIVIEIQKINQERRDLQVTRIKDIREVQMFIPVIVVLFFCSTVPVIHYIFIQTTRIIYREQLLAMLLFATINAATNLPIYYYKGSSFRKESRAVFFRCCKYK